MATQGCYRSADPVAGMTGRRQWTPGVWTIQAYAAAPSQLSRLIQNYGDVFWAGSGSGRQAFGVDLGQEFVQIASRSLSPNVGRVAHIRNGVPHMPTLASAPAREIDARRRHDAGRRRQVQGGNGFTRANTAAGFHIALDDVRPFQKARRQGHTAGGDQAADATRRNHLPRQLTAGTISVTASLRRRMRCGPSARARLTSSLRWFFASANRHSMGTPII